MGLLFKRLKSEGGLARASSGKRYRVEAGWYCKLPGQVARSRMRLLNPARLGRVVADGLHQVVAASRRGRGLEEALAELAREHRKARRRTARRERQSAAQVAAQDLEELAPVTSG